MQTNRYPAVSEINDTAKSLFDTDPEGNIINLDDVHPEYIRAVTELVARLTTDNNDGYDTVAWVLGLPSRFDSNEGN